MNGDTPEERAEQDHWTERGRATSVANRNVLGRPRRSVLALADGIAMYPFHPKSTARMKAGQYWAFRLRDGGFACGVVIALRRKGEAVDRRMFLAGLLDWTGSAPPASQEIEGRGLRERGYAHIKAITENGGDILGEVTPIWGYPEEVEPSDSISTWGFGVVRVYGEQHFGTPAG